MNCQCPRMKIRTGKKTKNKKTKHEQQKFKNDTISGSAILKSKKPNCSHAPGKVHCHQIVKLQSDIAHCRGNGKGPIKIP